MVHTFFIRNKKKKWLFENDPKWKKKEKKKKTLFRFRDADLILIVH